MIFGSLPITPVEIVLLLRDQVERTASSLGRVNASTPWTRAVFLTLKDGFVSRFPPSRAAFTNAGAEPASEFMLDFVWWELDETGAEQRAIMGVECEWTSAAPRSVAPERAAEDFRKLLSFKSPLKLFVFDSTVKSSNAVRERLCDCIRRFPQHVKGECYLFVEFVPEKRSDDRSFRCDGYVYYAEHDGRVPSSVELAPIGLEARATTGS